MPSFEDSVINQAVFYGIQGWPVRHFGNLVQSLAAKEKALAVLGFCFCILPDATMLRSVLNLRCGSF